MFQRSPDALALWQVLDQVYYPLRSHPHDNGDNDDGGALLYGLGHVVARDASRTLVRSRDGSEVALGPEDALPYSADAQRGVDDMCTLDELNAASLLTNVASRFAQRKIYTFVGPVLCVVNPFESLSVYGSDAIELYNRTNAESSSPPPPPPPHIYAIAQQAYQSMVQYQQSQSIVVSGESGAGKTESTKHILRYLTAVSGQDERKSGGGAMVARQIMDANPLLEAFGNAKTVRNNNSSRFGKLFEILFDRGGKIVGGRVTSYLLEKSRVVHQMQGERNYHVFYQLCNGASREEIAKYQLQSASEFRYLTMGNCLDIEGRDDAQEFQVLKESMRTIGISDSDRDTVFCTLAAILHLGNVAFRDKGGSGNGNGESVEIVDSSGNGHLARAAQLLNVGEDNLAQALSMRTLSARRSSVYSIPMSLSEAQDARDALSKALYGKIFDWLVHKVTDTMQPPPSSAAEISTPTTAIGVLDIFGFESFAVNSFEQLCINYANERLHQQFISGVFKREMEEYRKEGIDIDVPFRDNQSAVDLIDKRPVSVLALLVEQCTVRQGSDKQFAEKLHHSLGSHPNFASPRLARDDFVIHHFAGRVQYHTAGFLEKNKDQISMDIERIVVSSRAAQSLPGFLTNASDDIKARRSKTIAEQFREQLMRLVAFLADSNSHYVRCIKPNDAKRAGFLHEAKVHEQLTNCGVMETVQLRKVGFSVRMDKAQFVQRFGVLASGSSSSDGSACAQDILLGAELAPTSQWIVGRTKVLLKSDKVLGLLDAHRERAIGVRLAKVQALARGFIQRRRFGRVRAAAEALGRFAQARMLEKESRECKGQDKVLGQGAGRACESIQAAPPPPSSEAGWDKEEEEEGEEECCEYTSPLIERGLSVVMPGLGPAPLQSNSYSGWLYKDGQIGFKKFNWNRRWFTLRDSKIMYYSDEACADLKGVIVLDERCACRTLGRKDSIKGVGEYHFQLISQDRSMNIAADTKAAHDQWINAITESISSSSSRSDPGMEEWASAEVCLPDGSALAVKIGLSTTAKDLFIITVQNIGILQGLQFFALLQEKTAEDGTVESTRVIGENETIASIVAEGGRLHDNHHHHHHHSTASHGATTRLCIRKVIFLDDSMSFVQPYHVMLKFVFYQAVADVRKNVFFGEADTVELVATHLKILRRSQGPLPDDPDALALQLEDLIPSGLAKALDPPRARDLARRILTLSGKLPSKSIGEHMLDYVNKVRSTTSLFGSSYYRVSQTSSAQFPPNLVLAVNLVGLHLQSLDTRQQLASYPFEQIVRWGRSTAALNIILSDGTCWSFGTRQGEEINKFIGIYVKKLVEKRTGKGQSQAAAAAAPQDTA